MRKFEIMINKEESMKVINLLLDGKKVFNFLFRNDENNIMIIEHYDLKNNKHYFIKEVNVSNTYTVYSFIEDLRFIIKDLVKKFSSKSFGNYPEDIISLWKESIDKLLKVSKLDDSSLPKKELFKTIFYDFLVGKMTDKVIFTYLFSEESYVYFNSLKSNNIFFIKKEIIDNVKEIGHKFYFKFNDKVNYRDLINVFDKKQEHIYIAFLSELILTSEKSESKNIYINDLLKEL